MYQILPGIYVSDQKHAVPPLKKFQVSADTGTWVHILPCFMVVRRSEKTEKFRATKIKAV